MSWYRIVLTQEDLHGRRRDRCETELQLLLRFTRSPQAAVYQYSVVNDADEETGAIFYISPEVAPLAANLLTWYSGDVCEAPYIGGMHRLDARSKPGGQRF